MADPGIPALNRQMTREMLEKEATSSPDPHVRGYSVYLLGAEKDPSRKEIFLLALHDKDKRVRAQAALALAGLGEDTLPDLFVLLRDSDWRIRYRSAEALGMIRSGIGVDPLIQALSDEKDHVRYMSAKSLGILADRRAETGLIACLSDENEYVRRMAALSLGKIGGDEGRAALMKVLPLEHIESVRAAIQSVLDKKS
jgi:HEAT repeat protein